MKIRLTGLPAETAQAAAVLRDAPELDVIQVDGPYPNRGDSRLVRMYIEVRLVRLAAPGGDAP